MKYFATQPDVIEVLNDLLDLELNSVFQFLGESAPYLNHGNAALRRPLAQMVVASHRRTRELSNTIDDLGGTPIPRGLQLEDQYLAYLSLKFLLPRLINAKELAIARWEAARNLVGTRSPEAAELLDRHLAEYRADIAILRKAADLR